MMLVRMPTENTITNARKTAARLPVTISKISLMILESSFFFF